MGNLILLRQKTAQFATCPPSVFRHSRHANSALSGPKFRTGGPKFCTGPIICTSSKFCLVLDLLISVTWRVCCLWCARRFFVECTYEKYNRGTPRLLVEISQKDPQIGCRSNLSPILPVRQCCLLDYRCDGLSLPPCWECPPSHCARALLNYLHSKYFHFIGYKNQIKFCERSNVAGCLPEVEYILNGFFSRPVLGAGGVPTPQVLMTGSGRGPHFKQHPWSC